MRFRLLIEFDKEPDGRTRQTVSIHPMDAKAEAQFNKWIENKKSENSIS